MTAVHFHKYSALGNDILVLDPLCMPLVLTSQAVKRVCDRHNGIGADGICYGPLPGRTPLAMRYYNPDGSLAETSGNGLRVFARFLRDQKYAAGDSFTIATGGRTCQVDMLDPLGERVRIDMGRASFHSGQFPAPAAGDGMDIALRINGEALRATCVSMGNPHCVLVVDKLDRQQVKRLGPAIETHSAFPQRSNVQWLSVLGRQRIAIEIWERGAGYTLSSGSSACAAACVAILKGYCASPVTVEMPGGEAEVEADENWNVWLTGSVEAVFSGSFAPSFLESLS